jgi:uncharacterized protein (TIGR03437 family)
LLEYWHSERQRLAPRKRYRELRTEWREGVKAHPGDIVTLCGTGFGDTKTLVPADRVDSRINPIVSQLVITIGGMPLSSRDVLYAGLAPRAIADFTNSTCASPQGVER